MRISDWSSDVCSSDLSAFGRRGGVDRGAAGGSDGAFDVLRGHRAEELFGDLAAGRDQVGHRQPARGGEVGRRVVDVDDGNRIDHRMFFEEGAQLRGLDVLVGQANRSEEHTSELQSLMRISYAV